MKNLRNVLIMKYPAAWSGDMWREAMPVGNGEIGALVYGAVYKEFIAINHGKLWDTGINDQKMPDVSYILPKIRELLAQDKPIEAENVMTDEFITNGYNPEIGKPVPVGDIEIFVDNRDGFSDYERGIDMEKAEAYVKWTDGNTKYRRNFFVSRDNDVFCTSMTAKDGVINTTITLKIRDEETLETSSAPENSQTVATDGKIMFAATCEGQDYGMAVCIRHDGNETNDGEFIRIENATYVNIFGKTFISGKREEQWSLIFEDIKDINDYDKELEKHAKIHSKLFNATKLSFGGKDYDLSNEELLLKAYSGKAPIEFVEKMWSFGRHLLLCSSRENGYPCHLYGLWTGGYDSRWAFNMFNVNLEMIYWQALSGNMPELLMPVFEYVEGMMDDFRENAKKLFNCRGINIPSVSTPESGLHKKIDNPHIIQWTAGAGWLSQFYYDYYLCTGDKDFLKDRAMPFMYESALFFEDFLTIGEDGYLVSSPSNSPENTAKNIKDIIKRESEVAVNATMDFAILKELLTNLIEGSKITGAYAEKVEKWEEMLSRIPEYQVNEDGAIKEWMHPFYQDNYEHRHQSHLYPVFPGTEITRKDENPLYDAFVRAIELRQQVGLKDQSGWSLMYMSNIYARMGRGNDALNCIDYLARSVVVPSFFTLHNDWRRMGIAICGDTNYIRYAPLQIDANMGLTAAVQEMLLFSTTDKIFAFNAVPDKITQGEAGPLLSRTGTEITFEWNSETAKVKMFQKTEGKAVWVYLPDNMVFAENNKNTINVLLEKGKKYEYSIKVLNS